VAAWLRWEGTFRFLPESSLKDKPVAAGLGVQDMKARAAKVPESCIQWEMLG